MRITGLLAKSLSNILPRFCCALIVIPFGWCGQVSARVWYVAPGGTGNGEHWDDALGTIGGALAAADYNDEIWVRSATYSEAIVLKDGVGVFGGFVGTETARDQRDWSDNPTGIDARRLDRSVVTCTDVRSATLDGFRLTGGLAPEGGGIYCLRSSPTFSNCTITGNAAIETLESHLAQGGGVYIAASFPTLLNCTVTENTAYEGGGIYCLYSLVWLQNCRITGNLAYNGGGIQSDVSGMTLDGCGITENVAVGNLSNAWGSGGGLSARTAYFMVLANCTIAGNHAATNGGGILSEDASFSLLDCVVAHNTAAYRGGGITCYSSSSLWMVGCTVTANHCDAGSVHGLFSDGSNVMLTECSFTGSGQAIPGEGVIAENSSLTMISCSVTGFFGLGVGCFSSYRLFLDDCTLSRNRLGLAFSSTSAFVRGCTITENLAAGWNAEGGGVEIATTPESSVLITNCLIARNRRYAHGGGVQCWGDSSPTLIDCVITENQAMRGGGFSCEYKYRESNSSARLINCTISKNVASNDGGGVWLARRVDPTFADCSISDNSVLFGGGGGITCGEDTSPVFIRCTISGNRATSTVGDLSGGGIVCESRATPQFHNCIITGNTTTSGAGGISSRHAFPFVTNSIIAGNTAQWGAGGVFVARPFAETVFLTLSNCTIADNTASWGSGGIYMQETAYLSLTNSILWNPGDELEGTGWTCTWSNVQGGLAGEGNIDATPEFLYPWDGTKADLQLQPGSPCVDAGDPDEAMNDRCRPPGLSTERNDMGAFGGPGNCRWLGPTPTPTPTQIRPPAPTPTIVRVSSQMRLW